MESLVPLFLGPALKRAPAVPVKPRTQSERVAPPCPYLQVYRSTLDQVFHGNCTLSSGMKVHILVAVREDFLSDLAPAPFSFASTNLFFFFFVAIFFLHVSCIFSVFVRQFFLLS